MRATFGWVKVDKARLGTGVCGLYLFRVRKDNGDFDLLCSPPCPVAVAAFLLPVKFSGLWKLKVGRACTQALQLL